MTILRQAGGRRRWDRLQVVTLITIMNTPALVYRLVFSDAIRKVLFTGTFWKIGYRNRKWIRFGMVKFVSAPKRAHWLAALEKYFARKRPATAEKAARTNPIVSLRSE